MSNDRYKGKVIAIGGINGTGDVVTALTNWLATELKFRVIVVHSEDSGRLVALGAEAVPGLPFGISPELDVFYELTARKNNCETIIRPALELGKTVLCKNWTVASKVNYKLNFPKYWLQLERMEEMSRGFNGRTRITPDLSILINPDPVICWERLKSIEPDRPAGYYLRMQELYLQEIAKVPHVIFEPDEHNLYYHKVKAAIEAI